MVNTERKIGNRQAFSLIELVIVVVIIAIIGAIAIPRMSRGAQGASDSALTGDLNILRSAIDLYASEHNGTYPAVSTFTDQLTEFSDDSGTTSATKGGTDGNAIYGPYLRAVPTLPVGDNKGSAAIVDGTSAAPGDNPGGWIYNPSTGDIHANLKASTNVDDRGIAYASY